MVTSSVWVCTPWLGVAELMVGGAWLTVKPLVSVPVPAALVTETSLAPTVAELPTVMLAVIWVLLSTVKPVTVIPEPKLTVVTPKRLVPVMMTPVIACP